MNSGFRITTAQTTVDADCLFYCAGTGTPQFVDAPVSATRGQIHYIPPWNETLRTVICADGYLIPGNDFWTAGSTYSRTDTTSSPHIEGQHEILEKLRNAIPDVPHFDTLLDGRVGYRISAKDRFAIFGQLGDHAFLSTAHGSRGIVSAPLAAEVIASLACGMPVPVESDLMNHFQNRYAIKHKL
jgi:tRNA 5-methylaminomethyl-2-thiouridine biosynthesis bifunctional protein